MKSFVGSICIALLISLLILLFLHIEKRVYTDRKFRVQLDSISFNTPASYTDWGLEKKVRHGMEISTRCSILSKTLLEQIYEACRKCHYIRKVNHIERRLPARIRVTAEWRVPCAYINLSSPDKIGLVDSTGTVILREFNSIPKEISCPHVSGITCMRSSEDPTHLKENDMLKDGLDALLIISKHIPDGSAVQTVKVFPSKKNKQGSRIVFRILGSDWKSEIVWGKHIRKGGPFPGYIRPISDKIMDLRKSVDNGQLPPLLDLEFY